MNGEKKSSLNKDRKTRRGRITKTGDTTLLMVYSTADSLHPPTLQGKGRRKVTSFFLLNTRHTVFYFFIVSFPF